MWSRTSKWKIKVQIFFNHHHILDAPPPLKILRTPLSAVSLSPLKNIYIYFVIFLLPGLRRVRSPSFSLYVQYRYRQVLGICRDSNLEPGRQSARGREVAAGRLEQPWLSADLQVGEGPGNNLKYFEMTARKTSRKEKKSISNYQNKIALNHAQSFF